MLYTYASRKIRLSGDVEQNPGPTESAIQSLDSDNSVMASEMFKLSMEKLEVSLQSKLDNILLHIQSQAETLQRQEETLRRQEDMLKRCASEQEQVKKTVTELCTSVKEMESGIGRNKQSITDLGAKQEELKQTIAYMEDEIDRLEGFSRKNNIKIFGIPEDIGLQDEDCVEAVKNILHTYLPEVTWQPDVVERAHRLGKPNQRNTRPIVAKFLRWGDAMSLMKHREARADMQHDGIWVAQDLTRRQSQKLKQLKDEGKSGYFVNGRLRIKEGDRRLPTKPDSRWRNRVVPVNNHEGISQGIQSGHPINTTEVAVDVTATQPCDSGCNINFLPTGITRGPRTRSVTRQVELTQASGGSHSETVSVSLPSSQDTRVNK